MGVIGHSRYECKYLIEAGMVSEIRRHLQPFMCPDAHAAATSGIYTVSSLYFDSPDFKLLRMGQEGVSERLKLRARTYSDAPSEPVWLEIKRRHSGVVHKLRVPAARPAARALLALQSQSFATDARDPATKAFVSALLAFDARPVVLVRYRREAYEARNGGSVRVTFDTRIECAARPEIDFGTNPPRWQSAGLEGVVLEVKFTDTYPPWVQAFLARFELERRSVSKYTHAIESLGVRALPVSVRGGRSCVT